MVIAIICHVSVMIIDRYIYLTVTSDALIPQYDGELTEFRNTQAKVAFWVKAGLHFGLTGFVHVLVFWVYPIVGNVAITGKVNYALWVFYLLYLIYLIMSAIQLKLGTPSIRKGPFFLTQQNSLWSKWLLQVYLSVPFLCELRTFIDWALTGTALDLWQWLKFEDCYYRLYIAKINMSYYLNHAVGEAISLWWKFFIGICGTLVLILIIMIPLVIFSDLNFIVSVNPIKAMSVEFGFLIDNRNYFRIIAASRISDIHYLNDNEWESLQFEDVRDIDSSEKDDIQVLTIPLSGDSIWDITPEGRRALDQSLNHASSRIEILMTTTYTRDFPLNQKVVTRNYRKTLNNTEVINQLNAGDITKLRCPKFLYTLWRIPSAGDRLDSIMINRYADKFLTDIEFVLKVTPTKFEYWQMGIPFGNSLKELRFYVLSEKYSPATLNFGIVTFYLTVVIFLAQMLRLATGGSAESFTSTEMRRPDMLLDLSDAIYLARMNGDFKNEETLFYELMDIMRSPETVIMVTGRSSVKFRGKEKIE